MADPDRYAIAAVPAIAQAFPFTWRRACEVAAHFMFSSRRPETIRAKERVAWINVGLLNLDSRTKLIFNNMATCDLSKIVRKYDDRSWLVNTSNAIYIIISAKYNNNTECLKAVSYLIDLKIEADFLEKCLMPLLHDRSKIPNFGKTL